MGDGVIESSDTEISLDFLFKDEEDTFGSRYWFGHNDPKGYDASDLDRLAYRSCLACPVPSCQVLPETSDDVDGC